MQPPRISASGLRNTMDFLLFERLTSLGWNMPMSVFRTLCAMGGATLVPALVAGALLGARLLHRITQWPCLVLVGGFLIANLYAGGAYVLREVYSRRRHSVAGSPNERFFRALDFRARDVFLVYCAARILYFHGVLFSVDAVFLLVFRDSLGGLLTAGLVSVPLALCTLTLAVSARLATRANTTAKTASLGRLAALGLAALVTGLTVGVVLGDPWSKGTADSGTSWSMGTGASTGVAMALLVMVTSTSAALTATAVIRFTREFRHLDQNAFAIRLSGQFSTTPPMIHRPRWLCLMPVLHRHFTSSRTATAAKRTYAGILTVVLLLAGVHTSGSQLLPLPTSAELPVTRAAVTIGFVLLLGCTELALATSGPTTLGPHFRFAWENLLSHRHIAASVTIYCAAHAVLVATGVAAAAGLMNGTVLWQLPFLGLGVMSASLFAESLASAPKRLTDGTSAPSVFVACVSIGLALPAVAGSVVHALPLRQLAAFYSVCLFGGAITCIGRRIRNLPLRFAT